jgi:nitrate/TMAO reductase-like tetraheme cytochrome c subunit
MLHRKFCKYIITGCLILASALIIVGCNAFKNAKENPMLTEEESTGNAQLWSENCNRCHNLRAPSSYSDVQWEVAMHHMRVRADLTAIEQKKILEFLQASN